MAHRKEYEDQIALYSLGLLEGSELREIEAHLEEGCPVCSALLEDSNQVFTSLAYSLENEPLPEGLEDKILERLEPRAAAAEKRPVFAFWKDLSPAWLTFGSIAAAAVIVFLFVSNMSLRNELGILGKRMDEIKAKADRDRKMMDYVATPGMDVVELASKIPDMDASGKLLWDKDRDKALFLASNVPPPKEGMTYQLWAIEDGKPVSMGTFGVDEKGSGMMEVSAMPGDTQALQFAVTIEPEGGMPQPTGEMYLYGKL